jgi:hypothetical protein
VLPSICSPPRAVSAFAVLQTCLWKFSFELNMIPSYLMSGEGSIVIVSISWVLGIVIDSFLFVSHLCLVK